MLYCGYTLTDFPISIRLTSLALWQSNDCPSASKATLMNMDKYFMWIHYERLHSHNKAKHNKTVCIFLGIYCSMTVRNFLHFIWKENIEAHNDMVTVNKVLTYPESPNLILHNLSSLSRCICIPLPIPIVSINRAIRVSYLSPLPPLHFAPYLLLALFLPLQTTFSPAFPSAFYFISWYTGVNICGRSLWLDSEFICTFHAKH